MAVHVVLDALRHVWLSLEPLGLPMAVMGGIAVAAWQHPRATHDVDVLIGLGNTQVEQLLAKLEAVRIRPKRRPPLLSFGGIRLLQLEYDSPHVFATIRIDLLLADSEYHQEALRRRVAVVLPDVNLQVFVLSCEDLVIHKLLAGRIIDKADAAALLRANRATLDIEYLRKWITRLQLQSDLAFVWDEAFPGEELPWPSESKA